MNERRLNFAELAEVLRVKESTVSRWSWERNLPYIACGARKFFDLKKVEDWLQKQDEKRLARKAETKRAATEELRQAA